MGSKARKASRGTIERAADVVRERAGSLSPRVAIVLGSGLGGLAESLSAAIEIPYADLPGFPATSVAGHAGQLIVGRLRGVPVILQSGRFHMYEGHELGVVTLPVRVFGALGVHTFIVTNAAGGIRPDAHPPLLMVITDHINMTGRNPLVGSVVHGEPRFPDMSVAYDAGLRSLARAVAEREGIPIEEGVYAGVLGPSFETPAEIRMLRQLGADAVGMSTVPEVIVARARGMRVLGISAISNLGSGITGQPLSHDEVLAAGKTVAASLERLVGGVVEEIGRPS